MIILNRMVVGGTTMNTLEIIQRMKNDFNMILVTGSKEKDEIEVDHLRNLLAGVKLIHVPSMHRSINLWNDFSAYRKLTKLIDEYKPQVVHTIGAKPGILGRIAAKRCGVKGIVHSYHGHLFHSYFNNFFTKLLIRIERWLASITSYIIAISESQQKELSESYSICPVEKIKVIPVGIDMQNFQQHPEEKRKSFRDKYLVSDNEVAIGIAGRIVPIKNHFLFLRIAKAMAMEKQTSRIRFFIIGDGAHLRKRLEEFLDQEKIDHTYFPTHPKKAYITFTSWETRMDEVMQGLDIIVLTSLNEGTPVSLMEAQAAGKPIVASKVGAIHEVVLNNQSGFVCEHNEVKLFTEKLSQLIHNASLRATMGNAGKMHVTEKFSLERQVVATTQLYKSLM